MGIKQLAPLVVALFGSIAYAFQPVPAFEDRRMGFNLHSEYFSTDANLSQGGGGYASLGNGRSFETLSTRMATDFRLLKDWRFGGGGELVYAKSTDPLEDRTTTELNSAFFDSLYILRFGRLLFAPQIRYVHSLSEVDPYSDDIIAGEGTHQFEVGSWGTMKLGAFEPYFYFAYRSQNDGRAHMLPFQVGLKYYYQRIYVLGEIFGHTPLTNDRYVTQEYMRNNVTTARNAGSLRYYSVNQMVYEGRGEFGYKISPDFTFYGGAAHTIDGKSAAYGFTASLGITYTFGAAERTWDSFADDPDDGITDFTEDEIAREHRKKNPKKRKRKKEKFEPLRDEYDESLFTPSN